LEKRLVMTTEMNELVDTIYSMELPFNVRHEAWALWCKLFDIVEAEEKACAKECEVYEL